MSILGWCSLYVIGGCLSLIWQRRVVTHSQTWHDMEKLASIQQTDWKGNPIEDFDYEEHAYSFTEMIRCLVFWPIGLALSILMTLFNVLLFDLARLGFLTQVMSEVLDPRSSRVIKEG